MISLCYLGFQRREMSGLNRVDGRARGRASSSSSTIRPVPNLLRVLFIAEATVPGGSTRDEDNK